MPYYRLALANLGTSGLGSVIEDDVLGRTGVPDGTELRWGRVLDGTGALEFTLPVDDAFVTQANFSPGEREVHLYRDETLLWGGRLWRAQVVSVIAVRFACATWRSTLDHREMDEDLLFRNVDQLNIAWGLISNTQAKANGNLGITRGSSTPSGVTRSVAYCMDARDVVGHAIDDLAATDDGFDWDIDAHKVFRTYHPLRGGSSGVVLDTTTNVMDLQIDIDATDLANEVTGVKGGGSCNSPVAETDLDATSRAKYGLMQSSLSDDRITADFLFAKAADALRIAKQPRKQATVVLDPHLDDSPDLMDYDIGESVHLNTSRGFATFNQDMRIVEEEIRVRPGERERITLTLDSVLAP